MTVRLIEGQVPYTGGTAIEITADKVINLLLRAENNLLHVNDDNELYCDLQLENGIAVDDDLPVGVTTGIVNESDGRPQNGLLLHYETTSGAYAQRLYGGDGKLYFNGGTGERKLVYYAEDVDQLLQELHDELVEQLTMHAGEGIEIVDGLDYSAMRGPAPEGYHIPTDEECNSLIAKLGNLGLDISIGEAARTYLNIPLAGQRTRTSSETRNGRGYYWTCTYSGTPKALFISNTSMSVSDSGSQNNLGYSIRAFKDISVIPDNNWTTLFDGGSIATGAGIFHNTTDGLISISADGINWITIQDKNLGATTVYNNGDTMSEDNCGGYYQRGNNYMFPFTGTVTTSNIQVNANAYGPGNYYSSSTFITSGLDSRCVPVNRNLWGGETGVVTLHNIINNTGVLSVNGKKGYVIVADNVKIFELENNQDLDTAQEIFDWFDQGKYPIIHYDNNSYIFRDAQQGALTFICSVPELGEDVYQDNSIIKYKAIELFYIGSSVTNISFLSWTPGINYLDTDVNYSNPYIPQYDGSPATKKYVDDHDVHIGTTAPTDNLVEGRLWYDTTNDVLKSFNGITWDEVGNESADINTKTFFLTGVTQDDLITAQKAYDRFKAGKNPIIWSGSNEVYYYYNTKFFTGFKDVQFMRIKVDDQQMTSCTDLRQEVLAFRVDDTSDTVTQIVRQAYGTTGLLQEGKDYATPYIAEYNGSPATKLYVDQYGPCVPVYHLGGGNVITSYINFDMTGGTYKVKIQGYHGTTINRTITVTASSTLQGTFTSNLMEHYNYGCIVTIDPSVSTTMIIQIDSNSNFSVDDIYIEKINIQSGIVTATSIN